MDTDISHAVEERLAAIEARLDVLEGNGSVDDSEDVPVQLPTEEEVQPIEESPTSTYRARGRTRATTETEGTE